MVALESLKLCQTEVLQSRGIKNTEIKNYLDWDVNHHIVALLGLGEDAEMKLVIDTGLLVSR